jgi:hypothetical protein
MRPSPSTATCRRCRNLPPSVRHDDLDVQASQVGRSRSRSLEVTVGPAILYRDILPGHVTELAKTLPQRLGARRWAGGEG